MRQRSKLILVSSLVALAACVTEDVETVRYDLGGGYRDGDVLADAVSSDAELRLDATLLDAMMDTSVRDAAVDMPRDAPPCVPLAACGPNECGSREDGCGGTLMCPSCGGGLTCGGDRLCECAASTSEPGPMMSSATLRSLALSDWDEVTDTVMGKLETMSDVDWFVWNVEDSNLDPTNPRLTVTLTSPAGHDYTLLAYFSCTAGGSASTCEMGAMDTTFEPGCHDTRAMTPPSSRTVVMSSACDTRDESGKLYVRVQSRLWSLTCASYTVTARAE